jgi:hypothetical protein
VGGRSVTQSVQHLCSHPCLYTHKHANARTVTHRHQATQRSQRPTCSDTHTCVLNDCMLLDATSLLCRCGAVHPPASASSVISRTRSQKRAMSPFTRQGHISFSARTRTAGDAWVVKASTCMRGRAPSYGRQSCGVGAGVDGERLQPALWEGAAQ